MSNVTKISSTSSQPTFKIFEDSNIKSASKLGNAKYSKSKPEETRPFSQVGTGAENHHPNLPVK